MNSSLQNLEPIGLGLISCAGTHGFLAFVHPVWTAVIYPLGKADHHFRTTGGGLIGCGILPCF